MATEPINIPIQTSYDSDGADEAIRDAKELEKLDPTVTVDADTTDATTGLDAVTESAKALVERNPWVAEVLADVDAAKGDIDKLQTSLHDVGDAASTTGTKIGTDIEEGTNKASAATHSMAGNVLGDSAAMATGFGPLGEALGQITEGALGGEIALKQMLAAGIGLGAITIVVGSIQKGLEANKRIDAFNREKVDAFVDALKTAQTEVDILNTALRGKDDRIEFVDAADGKTKDLTHNLANAGITWDEFTSHIVGGKQAFVDWVSQAGTTIGAGADLNALIQAGTQFIDDRNKAQQEYNDWLFVSGQTTAETARETANLNRVYVDGSDALADLNPKTKTFAHHVDTAAENTAKLDENYRRLIGKLDEQEAWADVNQAITDYNENTKHSDEDTRNLIRSIADYVIETDTIPESKKTEILADLNEGDVAAAEAALNDLARTRDIKLLLTAVGSKDTIKLLTLAGRGGGGIVIEGQAVAPPSSAPVIQNFSINLPVGTRASDLQGLTRTARRGTRYGAVR